MFKDIILKMVHWNYLEKHGKLHSSIPWGWRGPFHHGAAQPRTHHKHRVSPSPAASCNLSFFPLHNLCEAPGLGLAHSHAAPGTAPTQQLSK